jgi:hypothetical protein
VTIDLCQPSRKLKQHLYYRHLVTLKDCIPKGGTVTSKDVGAKSPHREVCAGQLCRELLSDWQLNGSRRQASPTSCNHLLFGHNSASPDARDERMHHHDYARTFCLIGSLLASDASTSVGHVQYCMHWSSDTRQQPSMAE